MKIVFIYPSLSDTGFNRTGRPVLYSSIHPGLCYLKAACAARGMTDIRLIDLRMMPDWDTLRARLGMLAPDIVGITLMSPDYPDAIRAIRVVKEVVPSSKVVVGGYHPTIGTEEMAADPLIDHIIVGEGEIAFPDMACAIASGSRPDRIIRGEMPDVDALPFMDRELFDCLELPYDFFLPMPFATILAGRGCPYNCHFCSPAGKLMHGYRIRRRKVAGVLDEIGLLVDTYGIRSLQFWDDCFTEDPRWVDAFCDGYRRRGFRLPFVCQTRSDIICKHPAMMKRLRATGLVMASIGFESGSDRVLKFMNKGVTVKQNLRAAAICHALGIKIWAYHMYGIPTETPAEAAETARMVERIRPYRSSAAFFTPHPGSRFYDYCKANDLMLIDDHDDFVRIPELDKAKIRGVDYGHLRLMAYRSKRVSWPVKARIRIEKIVAHKRNKPFRRAFEVEVARSPQANKMALLRQAHAAGRL